MLNNQFVVFIKLKEIVMRPLMQLQSSVLNPLSLFVLIKTINQEF